MQHIDQIMKRYQQVWKTTGLHASKMPVSPRQREAAELWQIKENRRDMTVKCNTWPWTRPGTGENKPTQDIIGMTEKN